MKGSQEVYAVHDLNNLKNLPRWLQMRTYNTARVGLLDKNQSPLIGLQFIEGANVTKAGLVCIKDPELYDRAYDIIEITSPLIVNTLGKEQIHNDPKLDFITTLSRNEEIMEREKAFEVTCAVFGFDPKEGQAMLVRSTAK